MNAPLRRLSAVVMSMFLVLILSVTWVQYVQAPALNDDPRNVRTTYRDYGRDRGPIVVAGTPVAESVPVDDPFGFQRTYVQGDVYAPLTGFQSIVFQATGIEYYANDVLNGTATSLWLDRLQSLVTGRQPRGGSVELTIDPVAQQAAWDALAGRAGAAVAIDPRTGAVLAMVSTPSYDPNVLAAHSSSEVNAAWNELLADPARPMDNRAIAGRLYAPGSTFKLVDTVALLSTGEYTPDTQVPAPTEYRAPGAGSPIRNPGGGPCGGDTVTLEYALQESCNTPFAQLAVEELGDEALREQAEAFGFGQDLDVPMPVTPSRFPEGADGELDPAYLALAAIGQYDVRVTPLQMAMVSAAIANDGVLMTPYTIATERGPDLRVISETRPSELSRPMSPDVAEMMTQMMTNVVENGTGQSAQIPGVAVAGKTGTAESGIDSDGPEGNPHAWFTAFAPADDPQVAVAVVVENGGSLSSEYTGAQLAAPVARSIIEAVLAQ